jgi:D-alanyl-D-alanine dipeptidase
MKPDQALLLLTDPAIAAIPLFPSDAGPGCEPCVPLAGASSRIWLDTRPEFLQEFGYPLDYRVRVTVRQKLAQAAHDLPDGFGLLIKEALRPTAYQTFIFERRMQRLTGQHPELSATDIKNLTAQFIAPPDVAGHPTGGAFDVTLCDQDGHELDMGCVYDEDANHSAGRCYSDARDISRQAAQHRHVMFHVLQEQGFINYPFEWWHWSYGDRYWAVATCQPYALYGPY